MPKADFFSQGSPYLSHPLLTNERTIKEVDFVLSQVNVPPGGRILDIGCGPGRHSIELAHRGYHVIGVDPSLAMIEAAQRNALGIEPKPKFIQLRGEDYITDEGFNAAICLFTTLGQITEGEADHRILERGANALHAGGGFVVEVPNKPWLFKNLKTSEHIGTKNDYTQINRQFDPETECVKEVFRLVSPEGERSYLLRYRVFDVDELRSLLEAAGFNIMNTFGGYENTPLREDSPIIVMVARKPSQDFVSVS
jgi:SAM-dependent methyltransferase